VAATAGIAQPYVAAIEGGATTIANIAAALGVAVCDLMQRLSGGRD